MADALVLDTSVCFAFLEDEAGADVVESYLVEAKEGRMVIHPQPKSPLTRIHAEENHRWTRVNTGFEGRSVVLLRFALGHCPVNGFSPQKWAVLSSSYPCLSVSI